ncbi:MAG: hypothetical protein AAB443_00370 [Patescibacteria group bacterium]
MTKHKQYYDLLVNDNKEIFDLLKNSFEKLSADTNNEGCKVKFEELRRQVLRLVQKYENMLCGKTYKAGFGGFTNSLADKFRAEVYEHFPFLNAQL